MIDIARIDHIRLRYIYPVFSIILMRMKFWRRNPHEIHENLGTIHRLRSCKRRGNSTWENCVSATSPRNERRKKSFEVPHLYCTSHLAHKYENRGRFSRPAKKLAKFYTYRRYLLTEISHVAFHRRGYTLRRREEKIYIFFGRIVQCIKCEYT